MDTKLLRQKILDLAIRGKLVPQDPNDEPASVLLERIKAEKERLIKEGKIKRSKQSTSTSDSRHYVNAPFEIPGNWAWCKLEDIVNYEQPTQYIVDSVEYNDSYNTPVLTAGKSFILGRTNETKGIFSDLPCIIFDDFTTESKLVTFPFKVKSSAMKILKVEAEISIKYVALFMSITRLISKSHKRYWISEYSKIPIPIPPTAEQKRIIAEIEKRFALIDQIEQAENSICTTITQAKSKILNLAIQGKLVPQDPADEPASELLKRVNPSAEITCDNEHYPQLPSGWIYVRGKDVFRPLKSTKPTGTNFKYIDIDSIDNKNQCIKQLKIVDSANAPSRASRYTRRGDVVFSMVRPYLRNIAIVPEDDCIASTGFYICSPTNAMTTKYCYYLMISDYVVNGLNQFMKGDNSPSINKSNIEDWLFPIPPLNEQIRISNTIERLYNHLDSMVVNL